MGYWEYPPYVSVAEKKAQAARKREKLMKKNPGLQPVLIGGRTIAHTWWGKSWNQNLERYADYSNRIGRGRSYVRHGAVLDLQISPGEVKTLVQGSMSKPYSIVIKIKSINKDVWKKIKAACGGKLESLQELLMGKFPKALGEVFMEKGAGLFPAPKEIEFNCSCPDWASMCKHVAASLYGIGARMDRDPSVFFKLRKANIDDLVTQAVEDKTKKLLKKAEKKSAKVLDDSGLSELFGIEMEEDVGPKTAKRKPKKATVKAEKKDKAQAKKAPAKVKKTAVKSKTATTKKAVKVKPKSSKAKSSVKKAVKKTAANSIPKTAKKSIQKVAAKKAMKTSPKKVVTKKVKSAGKKTRKKNER